MFRVSAILLVWLAVLPLHARAQPSAPPTSRANGSPTYDLIIRGGTVYDGSGAAGKTADVAISGDRIAAVGDLGAARAKRQIDARGLAVAPGFINMLSWATMSLLADGRSQSDIRQGVTLEVFGEGWSMGPLNARMKKDMIDGQGDIKYDVPWTTLGEYLEHLVARGVSCNVASFVGATTVRIHVLGYEDRPANERAGRNAATGSPGDAGRRPGRRLVADLRAGLLCRHPRADRAVQGRRRISRACTSRTFAAKATSWPRRSRS